VVTQFVKEECGEEVNTARAVRSKPRVAPAWHGFVRRGAVIRALTALVEAMVGFQPLTPRAPVQASTANAEVPASEQRTVPRPPAPKKFTGLRPAQSAPRAPAQVQPNTHLPLGSVPNGARLPPAVKQGWSRLPPPPAVAPPAPVAKQADTSETAHSYTHPPSLKRKHDDPAPSSRKRISIPTFSLESSPSSPSSPSSQETVENNNASVLRGQLVFDVAGLPSSAPATAVIRAACELILHPPAPLTQADSSSFNLAASAPRAAQLNAALPVSRCKVL
jgi:hypothetical protein